MVPIFVGHLADRVNRSRLYGLSLLLIFLATVLLVFSRSVGDIILFRGLGGLGLAFYWPITEILVLDLKPRERVVREMGLYSVSWGSAFLIGPFLGGVIIQEFGFVELFVISSALIVFSLLQAVVTVLGGCFGVIFPLSIGLISRHFQDEQAGAAVGSYETVVGIGNAIGPVLGRSSLCFECSV